jgi:MFS family permease
MQKTIWRITGNPLGISWIRSKSMSEQLKEQTPFRRVLTNRNFRLLWAGGSISVLGSQFSLIALPWLVLQLTGDPQVLGLVLALAGLSRAAFMLYGGVITDRFSPRRILLVCDWMNFLLSGIIAALVFTGSMQIWMICLFSLVTGSISGFVIPADNSIIPTLLPDEDLQAGNSINMGTQQLMGFAGPALAGVIIGSYTHSTLGIVLAFAFDSLTFAFSAVLLGLMRGVERVHATGAEKQPGVGAWSSIKAAASYLFHHETLRLLFLVMVVVNFLFTGPLLVGIPALADQRLAEGAAAFGLLMSAFAGGNLVGYVLGGVLPKPKGYLLRMILVGATASFGVVLAAFGWIRSTWVDLALILAIGIGNGYIGLVLFTWIQQSTPRDMLGRMMSMISLAGMGLVPLSQAVSGALIKWNMTGLFLTAGSLLVLVVIWMGFQPGLKTLSEQVLESPAAGELFPQPGQ